MPIFRQRPDLLAAFRAGDRAALEAVYRAYVARVERIMRFGFRLESRGVHVGGVPNDAAELEDLVQEAFSKAFSPVARARFDGEREFAPYLFTIVRNVLVDWARTRRREIPAGWNDVEATETNRVPEEEHAWADPSSVPIVERYVTGLPSALRAVHEKRYVEGLSQQDAAAALGLTRQRIRTLEKHLHDGVTHALRQSAARRGVVELAQKRRRRTGPGPGQRRGTRADSP